MHVAYEEYIHNTKIYLVRQAAKAELTKTTKATENSDHSQDSYQAPRRKRGKYQKNRVIVDSQGNEVERIDKRRNRFNPYSLYLADRRHEIMARIAEINKQKGPKSAEDKAFLRMDNKIIMSMIAREWREKQKDPVFMKAHRARMDEENRIKMFKNFEIVQDTGDKIKMVKKDGAIGGVTGGDDGFRLHVKKIKCDISERSSKKGKTLRIGKHNDRPPSKKQKIDKVPFDKKEKTSDDILLSGSSNSGPK